MRLAAGCTTKTSAPYICCAILTLVLCAVYFGKSGRQTVSLDHQHIGLSPPNRDSVIKSQFTIANPEVCARQEPELIIFIHSLPVNYLHRRVIRQTWGDSTRYLPLRVVVLYIIGGIRDKNRQAEIDLESNKFNDMVQDSSFFDGEDMSSMKALSMLEWTVKYCKQAKLVMKADDYSFILPVKLSEFVFNKVYGQVKKPSWPEKSVIGRVVQPRVLKHNKNLKESSEAERLGDYYPERECYGSIYLITADSTAPLLASAEKAVFLRHGDIYITGVLAEHAHLKYIDISRQLISHYTPRYTRMMINVVPGIFAVGDLPSYNTTLSLWIYTDSNSSARVIIYLLLSVSFIFIAIKFCHVFENLLAELSCVFGN